MRGTILVAFAMMAALAAPAEAADADRIRFVTAYIRHIDNFEDLRAKSIAEASNTPQGQVVDCVREMTRFQLELNSYIRELEGIKLEGQFKEMPGLVQGVYRKRADLYGKMGKACEIVLRQQKPGFDYGGLAADTSKVTAELDFTDQSMFKFSPAVALTLVDTSRKNDGKFEHLIVTRAERDDLLVTINRITGINAKAPKYGPAAALMIREILTGKLYRAKDEP